MPADGRELAAGPGCVAAAPRGLAGERTLAELGPPEEGVGVAGGG